ncbi:RNA-directed DNA polymerase protein [Dioscorea alata]|uniref:RNA-directed DNA polymerase protein n=1 Tax=Dioscorea alata TaxID=55571 RepID=A0ACB7UVP1_DIOAL|nr:RNA-directed DNA polymerase protein [Dioscorea alata]
MENAITIAKSLLDISKIDQFTRVFFKRWQQKVYIALDMFNLVHILTKVKQETTYEVYTETLPIWEKDAENQKYATRNFSDFQMTEDKDVSSQIHDYHVMLLLSLKHLYMVSNAKEWIIDCGATRHISTNRNAFQSYIPLTKSEEQVYMEDSSPSRVLGKGKVLLKLTLRKTLFLNDVLHALDLRVNLVCVLLLGKSEIKLAAELDKLGYCSQGLIILNVLNVNNGYKTSSSAYIVNSIDLGHVNFSYIKKMRELGLIHNMTNFNKIDKCEILVESKSTKKGCKSIEREFELLGLIHSDLCDFKDPMTKGGEFKTFELSILLCSGA